MPVREMKIDAFVLAGGASSRMGQDKALIRLGELTLVERALQLLRSIGLAPRIVGSRPDLERFAPVIADLRRDCGPLSGIEAGLFASESGTALFLPVDVPLLPAQLLVQLLARAELTMAAATMPRILGQHQPLCAIYRRDLLPILSKALDAGDYKVMRVIQQGVAALSQSLDIFDIEITTTASGDYSGWPRMMANAFLNCNTPEDLAQMYRFCHV